ncbi:U6 snRNA phosphodiesterase isoform X1 [Melanaphis sacchari]|uniref:U6 snRNA phosphodiesterase isoform X1 n=2 Tax=Melanaphis sacchari TaxID=742174 RepID=UPI000DC130A0|nr:U6 snRNA phosphodiesterase isoform X1 [Melanaphis sacchari]
MMDLIQHYSGDSDDEHDKSEQKMLPVPEAITKMFDGKLYHPKPNDKPDSHQGRTRLFEHERGNWATYVYIPCPDMDLIEIIQEKLVEFGLEIIEHPHISLTKTVVLQYHWIQHFINDIKSKLSTILRFSVTFGNLEVFCNENCSRTFIGFLAKPKEVLSQCVDQLDKVLSDYNLEKYYEDPKFHLSVAWCLGDQSSQLRSKLKSLELEIEVDTCRSFKVEKLMCKTGNKTYNFDLV